MATFRLLLLLVLCACVLLAAPATRAFDIADNDEWEEWEDDDGPAPSARQADRRSGRQRVDRVPSDEDGLELEWEDEDGVVRGGGGERGAEGEGGAARVSDFDDSDVTGDDEWTRLDKRVKSRVYTIVEELGYGRGLLKGSREHKAEVGKQLARLVASVGYDGVGDLKRPAHVVFALADYYRGRKRVDLALDVFEGAVDGHPSEGHVYLHEIAREYMRQEKPALALHTLQRAMGVRRSYFPVLLDALDLEKRVHGAHTYATHYYRHLAVKHAQSEDQREELEDEQLASEHYGDFATELGNTVDQWLEAGRKVAMRGDADTAIAHYERAFLAGPAEHNVGIAVFQGASRRVPARRVAIASDSARADAYAHALDLAVTPGATVLTFQSHGGVVAALAAQRDALVIGVDTSPHMARVVREVALDNDVGDAVRTVTVGTLARATRRKLGMDQRAHVLVLENLDEELVGQGVLPAVLNAHRKLLHVGAQVIPRRSLVYFALLQSDEIADAHFMAPSVSGIDTRSARAGMGFGIHNVDVSREELIDLHTVEHTLLSDIIAVFELDFMDPDLMDSLSGQFSVPIRTTGRLDALVMFTVHVLDEETYYSDAPPEYVFAEDHVHVHSGRAMQQRAWVLSKPQHVHRGEVLTFQGHYDAKHITFVAAS